MHWQSVIYFFWNACVVSNGWRALLAHLKWDPDPSAAVGEWAQTDSCVLISVSVICNLCRSTSTSAYSPREKSKEADSCARFASHVQQCTVNQTAPRACFVFRSALTRQWHARGEPERAGSFDLLLANGRSTWAEPRFLFGSNRSRSRERTAFVAACLTHVSWDSYCTPGGNVLPEPAIPVEKKKNAHVFSGLQGKGKSRAAAPDDYRQPELCSNRQGAELWARNT